MMRLLLVLALVASAAVYFAGGSGKDAGERAPKARYDREAERVDTLERQMQEQAAKQLDTIDAESK